MCCFASSIAFALNWTRMHARIFSFCSIMDLKILEIVCKLTNNESEIQELVDVIRRGHVATKSVQEIAEIKAAMTHLCYMTENLTHKPDVRFYRDLSYAEGFAKTSETNLLQIHRRHIFIRRNACEVVAKLLRVPEHYDHSDLIEEVMWSGIYFNPCRHAI